MLSVVGNVLEAIVAKSHINTLMQ